MSASKANQSGIDVLVVDDDEDELRSLIEQLGQIEMVGKVGRASSKGEATREVVRAAKEGRPLLLLLDVCLVAEDHQPSLELVRDLRERKLLETGYCDVILTSCLASTQVVREFKLVGEFSYVGKVRKAPPVNLELEIERLARAMKQRRDARQANFPDVPDGVVVKGRSAALRAVYREGQRRVRLLGKEDPIPPFLIVGETGSGKEALARCLHYWLDRKDKGPFVPVPTAQFNTGDWAVAQRTLCGVAAGFQPNQPREVPGLMDEAGRGALSLDDAHNISLQVQGASLRLVQFREFSRLGEARVRRSPAMLIFTLNELPEKLLAEGRLREDFYARLIDGGSPLVLPPFRERPEDVVEVARHFCRAWFERQDRTGEIADDAEQVLLSSGYDWPGNGRDVKSLMWDVCLQAFDLDEGRAHHVIRAESVRTGIDKLRRGRGAGSNGGPSAVAPGGLSEEQGREYVKAVRRWDDELFRAEVTRRYREDHADRAAKRREKAEGPGVASEPLAEEDAEFAFNQLWKVRYLGAVEALLRANHNKTRAAEISKIGRATLYRYIALFDLT